MSSLDVLSWGIEKLTYLAGSYPLPEVIDAGWQAFAMTFDHTRDELTAWLNGSPSERWQENVRLHLNPVYNAWVQGNLGREPGLQPGEDPGFPLDQVYSPPEDTIIALKVLHETESERVELREYRYTRVRVTLQKAPDGSWSERGRDLAEIRLNPWWYPHGLYSPPDATQGGPFTIGRVIHSSRSVGFTGWIGAVAVFDQALTAAEIARLSAMGRNPIPGASPR